MYRERIYLPLIYLESLKMNILESFNGSGRLEKLVKPFLEPEVQFLFKIEFWF